MSRRRPPRPHIRPRRLGATEGPAPRLGRRRFITLVSGSAVGVAVLGSACTDGGGDADPTVADTSTATPTTTSDAPTTVPFGWERVDLGFVSAYVLLRGSDGVVVDTGTGGSADAIESVLTGLGIDWGDVGHVVLTHRHPDHVGSLPEVVVRAPGATLLAGGEDIPAIDVDGVVPVADGDTLLDELVVVATPGHTPGHVSVHHPGTRLLVAGDALNGGDAMGGEAGTVAGPNPDFTPDMETATDSVAKLAALDVDTVVFGHGSPVVDEAGAQIAALVG